MALTEAAPQGVATVEALVRKSGVQEGLCLGNAMLITASVYINDAEDALETADHGS